jgi:hypothetical protein
MVQRANFPSSGFQACSLFPALTTYHGKGNFSAHEPSHRLFFLMNLNFFFALLGGLLVLAFVANRLVRFTGVSDVIILMATGVVIGPVLHWVNPELFRDATHGFGSLALILILFEGGLDLKLREILRHFAGAFFLSLIGYVLTMGAAALVCRQALHFTWVPALLVGAVLGCISSSIILPVLQQVELRHEVRVTLLVEASLGDALAVLAVTALIDVAAGGSASRKPSPGRWSPVFCSPSPESSRRNGLVLPFARRALLACAHVCRRTPRLLRRSRFEGQRARFRSRVWLDALQFSFHSKTNASR